MGGRAALGSSEGENTLGECMKEENHSTTAREGAGSSDSEGQEVPAWLSGPCLLMGLCMLCLVWWRSTSWSSSRHSPMRVAHETTSASFVPQTLFPGQGAEGHQLGKTEKGSVPTTRTLASPCHGEAVAESRTATNVPSHPPQGSHLATCSWHPVSFYLSWLVCFLPGREQRH